MSQKSINSEKLLYFVFILAVIPLMAYRDFVPANELRYLSIVDEALKNHNFFAFTNHGIAYADKPPLYFWLLMLCRSIAGGHFLIVYGLFSIIPAIITVRIFAQWTKGIIREENRTVFQLMLMTTGLFLALSIYLRMDMLMCMFIVLALYEFWKIYSGKHSFNKSLWLFPIYIFLAVFTKGPFGIIIPVVSVTTFILICRRYKMMQKIFGWRFWIVLLPCCALWFYMVYAEGGREYIGNLLLHQTMGRAVKSFHHAEPFYYYFVCIWYCLAPWCLAVLAKTILAIRNKFRLDNLLLFFLTIAITTILILSCVSSKIEVYLLPAIPFIIYSFAISIAGSEEKGLIKAGLLIPSLIFIFAFPTYLANSIFKILGFQTSIFVGIACFFLTLSGIISVISLYKTTITRGFYKSVYCIGYGILISLFCIGFAMPDFNPHIGYRELSKAIETKSQETGIRQVRSWHVGRPENMDVYMDIPVGDIEEENYFPAHLGDKTDEPYILVTRVKRLECLGGLKSDTIGKYCITIFDKTYIE